MGYGLQFIFLFIQLWLQLHYKTIKTSTFEPFYLAQRRNLLHCNWFEQILLIELNIVEFAVLLKNSPSSKQSCGLDLSWKLREVENTVSWEKKKKEIIRGVAAAPAQKLSLILEKCFLSFFHLGFTIRFQLELEPSFDKFTIFTLFLKTSLSVNYFCPLRIEVYIKIYINCFHK